MNTNSCSEIDMEEEEQQYSRTRNRNPTGVSMTSLQKISLAITGSMEKFFYRWGVLVASHPKKFILGCLLITAVCGLGIFNFTTENRPDRLWIPRNSEFAQNTEWLRATFPSPIRSSWAMITADNVLIPDVMRVIIDIHEKVKKLSVLDGTKFEDICYKLPITKFSSKRRRKRSDMLYRHLKAGNLTETFFGNALDNFEDNFDDEFFNEDVAIKSQTNNDFDQLFNIPDELYCSIMTDLDDACYVINPAELWSFDRSKIYNLTEEDIIHSFNHELISPVFGRKVNYTVELGGDITRNSNGEIIGAQSVMLKWSVGINQTVIQQGTAGSDGTGEIVDEACLAWEKQWTELMKNISKNMPNGINVYFVNSLSWMDISEATLFEDSLILGVGFLIMFAYVGTMLGRFNMIEQRPFLTMAGLSCVGLACIISYGICSLCFIVYGPVNKILPFLLLGIGIDDMFVIMQCWNNLFPSPLTSKSKLSIPEQMGMTLRHAGVSISVTSLTDVAAFTVGASTILPGLQSFCIYAAVGIIAVFVFQATYFVAWLAIDQERIEAKRNSFFPWIKYKDEEFIPNSWSQVSFAQNFFDKVLSKYLFTNWMKGLAIFTTLGFLSAGIYGMTSLRQEFDPMWFLPDDSYMSQYVQKRDQYYPGLGYPAFVVANNVNWSASFMEFEEFVKDFKGSGTLYNFENWYEDFKEYSNKNFGTDIPRKLLTPRKFQKYMGKFLFSPSGSKHRAHFKVDGNFSCGDSLPPVKTVIMPFRFRKFNGPEEHIPGLNKVKSIVRNSNLTFNTYGLSKLFPWGTGLVAWETDAIINTELYRNVALSLICVLITTFLLLANFRVCLFSGICVIFTLVNVLGFMHFMGLTIDTVSCIDIVLGIGLCVDYAAHIGLAFLTCTGSKESRAKQAIRNIGPAVANGGFSTFLAIILLASSKSHAFQSFFKIFTMVIFFGLFHGLIFLPVLLSLFGPEPYPFAYSREDIFDQFEKKTPPKIIELHTISSSNDEISSNDFQNSLEKEKNLSLTFTPDEPLLFNETDSHLECN